MSTMTRYRHFLKTVPNTLCEIFNMFDRTQPIKHYIFFNIIKLTFDAQTSNFIIKILFFEITYFFQV